MWHNRRACRALTTHQKRTLRAGGNVSCILHSSLVSSELRWKATLFFEVLPRLFGRPTPELPTSNIDRPSPCPIDTPGCKNCLRIVAHQPIELKLSQIILLTPRMPLTDFHSLTAKNRYSKTCAKRPPLGVNESGLCRQVTSIRRFQTLKQCHAFNERGDRKEKKKPQRS